MAAEENETSNGWPLGLEIMNMRLGLRERLQAAQAERHNSTVHLRSSSFSSFSSSNLDTEGQIVVICELNQSTASFFQDHSVSLGRLIGIRPPTGDFYFPRRIYLNERDRKSVKALNSEVTTRHTPEMSQGICIPLLVGTLEKISRSKSKTKR